MPKFMRKMINFESMLFLRFSPVNTEKNEIFNDTSRILQPSANTILSTSMQTLQSNQTTSFNKTHKLMILIISLLDYLNKKCGIIY